MPRLGGLLLSAGCVAIGIYMFPAPFPGQVAQFAESARLAAAPVHPLHADSAAVRTFSPASPVFREVLTSSGDGRPDAPTTGIVKPSAWTTVVTADQSQRASLRSSNAADPETRYELARDLQRELRRAGCYWGEINGVWNFATRDAMATFLDRANATLPVREPDYVLLALAKAHNDISCSGACPRGQTAQGSRCVPTAMIAQASKRARDMEERRTAEARLSRYQPLAASAEPERLPWLDGAGRSVAQADVAPRPELPEGRMSIGGPLPASAPSAARGAPVSEWQQVTIEADQKADQSSATSPNGSKLAALAPGGQEAGEPGDASTAGQTVSIEAIPELDPKMGDKPRSSRSHRASDARRAAYYASSERTRHGQPRPGTMRYNVMHTLGGIY